MIIRTRLKSRVLSVVLLLLLPAVAEAQTYSNKPGMAAAQFLRIGVTARGEALGDAVIANVSDASAAYYNPAGLLHVGRFDAVVSRTEFPADVGMSFGSVAMRLSHSDVLAFSAVALESGDMKVRTVLQPGGTGETFRSFDMALGLSYARNITDRLGAGMTGRFLWMKPVTGMFEQKSWALDVGIQYDTGLQGMFSGLIIGMTVTSFGPQIAFVRETYGLPLTYRVGVSKPISLASAGDLTAVLNWSKAMDASERAQIGFEYGFQDMFFLRSGYKFASGSEQSWTGGVGFNIPVTAAALRMDYAYSAFGLLGGQHRVSLGIQM